MRILATNDDGVYSPGLRILVKRLSEAGEVLVIAPDRERSAIGHSFSMHHPIRVREIEPGIVSSDGTPTDCVMLGVLGYSDRKPDLVVAGINLGPNMGTDVTYSGTVSAALEATILGVPAFSLSLDIPRYVEPKNEPIHWETAAGFAKRLAEIVAREGLPEGVFLNVNVPNQPPEEIRGVEITRLGQRVYRDKVIRRVDPLGKEYFWVGGEHPTWVPEEGTDFSAVAENLISVTPISFRLTALEAIDQLKEWRQHLNGAPESTKRNT